MFVGQYCQYGWELRGALVYPCKVVRGALCEPLCMGWLERGSGGPGQLHSSMSTGEDWYLPIVQFLEPSSIWLSPRKFGSTEASKPCKKKNFGRASHGESDPVSSPVDVLNHVSQCRFLKEQRF